jgi:hypothetical protein
MRTSNKRLIGLAAVVAVLMSTTLIIVSATARNRTLVIRKANEITSANPKTPGEPSVALAQRPRPLAQIESELITITAHGFEPAAITRAQGRFLLMVDNRSGLNDLSIQLRHEGGAQLREIFAPREEPNWSDVIDPAPGRYLLTEASHPRWRCLVTITPQP